MSRILSMLLALIFSLHYFHQAAAQAVDPIKFTISTQAKQVGLGQEFEIIIKAQYVTIPANTVFILDGSNLFKLKLVLPEGYKQTGGTYHDYIGTTLSKDNSSITYTLRGQFISASSAAKFVLLRGGRNADEQSVFYSAAAISFSTESSSGLSSENAREMASLTTDSLEYVPYMSINDLRAGKGDSDRVIQIIDSVKAGTFVYDPLDSTSADDGVMVLKSGSRRYLRLHDGVVRVKWITGPLQTGFTSLLGFFGDTKPVTIILDKTIPITSYVKIGSNIKIDFQYGATFDVASGVSMDIISEITEGNQQLFSGPGTVRIRTDRINITWFGAKDENLDNSFAFEAAHRCLNALGNYQGGTIFIPPGIYRTKMITAISRVNYLGAGIGVSIIRLKDNEQTDLLRIPTNSFLVSIKDLSLDGNSFNNQGGGSCISVDSTTNVAHNIDVFRNKDYRGDNAYKFLYITNVACVKAKRYGIYLPRANFITSINNVYLQFNEVGLWNESTDNMFDNIVAEKNYQCGIRESGANNKWNSIKAIFNGVNKQGYYGGFIMYNCKRTIVVNGESQDNFGPGVRIENGESIMLSNYLSDCNGYYDGSQTSTDSTSEGFKFLNMTDSKIIGCKATNYRYGLTRPWIQTFAYSQDIRCTNNEIDITSFNQEKAPKTVFQSLSKNVNIISRRNTSYTLGPVTFDVDQPVIDNGVLVTANDRIELPTVIPYRNVLSYLFQFHFMGTSGNATQFKIINTSDGLLKLDYVTGTKNSLIATIVTPKGTFSAGLDVTLEASKEYRVYFEIKKGADGWVRSEIKLSYLNSSSGVVFLQANKNYAVSGEVIGSFENVLFNDYGGSPAGNTLMRLIYFMMAEKTLPDDASKIGFPVEGKDLILSVDFANTKEKSLNTIKSGSLPKAGAYYLNKTFNTNAGQFICVEDGIGGYKFISASDNSVKAFSATGDGVTNPILIPHGFSYTPTITGIVPKNASSANISYSTADATYFKIYHHTAPPVGSLSYTISSVK